MIFSCLYPRTHPLANPSMVMLSKNNSLWCMSTCKNADEEQHNETSIHKKNCMSICKKAYEEPYTFVFFNLVCTKERKAV